MTDTTSNLRLSKPDFDSALWHDLINDNFEIIDAAINTYITISGIVGVWENSTAYVDGDKVIDTVTSTIYECNISHTSAASPVTFATDRNNNPLNWIAPSVAARGTDNWVASTSYLPNDFAIGNGNIFAICTQAHISGSSFSGDSAYWDYLLDLSTLATFPTLIGHATEYVRVNAGETSLEYRTIANFQADMGYGTIAFQNSSNVNITGGTLSGVTLNSITDIAVVDGGTGSSTAAGARTNLGLGGLAVLSTVTNTELAASVITGQTEDTAPDLAADYALTYDASATSLKKTLLNRVGDPTASRIYLWANFI